MKKLRDIFLIVLAVALVLAVAGIVAGTVLGAQPLDIAGAIWRDLTARTHFDSAQFLSNIQGWIASLTR